MIKSIIKNLKNRIIYHSKDIIIGSNVSIRNTTLEGKNKIYKNSIVGNCKIGKGTYIGEESKFSHTIIGNYCSIGNRVKIITATHPAKTFVSTHPAFFSISKQGGYTYVSAQKFQENKYLNESSKTSVIIGNDVWIGDEAMIIGGVKISDGAIIGSRALVTKDVPPYTIVGGVPAKVIGKRFSDMEIDFLLNLKWWEKDESWIVANLEAFSDIRLLMHQD